ncbi:MAG: hypothetical protein GY855_07905 [candidate division Zixibacteria bacterium]|nr:hypothetical protein [candidate division Zixibacteria bacterium]
MNRSLSLCLAMLFIILMASGCYTILQHPDSEINYTAEDYQTDCLECHAEYHEYPYGYFYGQYPDYWWSSPRWGRYYAYPWWWDNYWYEGNYQHSEYEVDDEPSPRSTRGKKVERRSSLRPPYTTGSNNISRSSGNYNTGTSSPTSNPSDQKDNPSDNPNDTKVKAKKEEKKKENKKAPRRGGGRSR